MLFLYVERVAHALQETLDAKVNVAALALAAAGDEGAQTDRLVAEKLELKCVVAVCGAGW